MATTAFHRRPHVRTHFLTGGTGLRIVAVPIVMAMLLAGAPRVLTCIVFLLAAATDWLDGYLARRWEVTTTLGSFLDTTADKLLTTGVLVALVAVDRASAWIAVLIVGREILILGLRGVIAADGVVMKASPLARWKTTVQFTAIAFAIVRPWEPLAGLYADEWLMLAAAVVTVWSAVEYLVAFSSSLKIETTQ